MKQPTPDRIITRFAGTDASKHTTTFPKNQRYTSCTNRSCFPARAPQRPSSSTFGQCTPAQGSQQGAVNPSPPFHGGGDIPLASTSSSSWRTRRLNLARSRRSLDTSGLLTLHLAGPRESQASTSEGVNVRVRAVRERKARVVARPPSCRQNEKKMSARAGPVLWLDPWAGPRRASLRDSQRVA